MSKMINAKEALKYKPNLSDKSEMYDDIINEFNDIVKTARSHGLTEFSFDISIVHETDMYIFEYELKTNGYSIIGKDHDMYNYTYTIQIDVVEPLVEEIPVWKQVPEYTGETGQSFSAVNFESSNW